MLNYKVIFILGRDVDYKSTALRSEIVNLDQRGVSMVELFASDEIFRDVNSADKTLVEKIRIIEALEPTDGTSIFSLNDSLFAEKKLKNTLSSALKLAHLNITKMDLLVQVRDTEAQFLMELLKKFDFVKVKQQTEQSPILESLERSIEQMQDMRAGKLPKPAITELFDNE